VQPAIVSLSAGKFYMDPVPDMCVVNAYARMEVFLLLLDYNNRSIGSERLRDKALNGADT